MVLDMQARLLLDMLGRGIESALTNSSAFVPELWQATGETLSSIDPETMAVEPSLIPCVQVCFGYSMEFVVLYCWSLFIQHSPYLCFLLSCHRIIVDL
jgi:hypothetical protein